MKRIILALIAIALIASVPFTMEAKKKTTRKKAKTENLSGLTALERKVVGKHMLSLQWISWESFGSVEIKKEADGTFAQSEISVTGTPDATRLAMRGMHRQMAALATPALELPKEERNFSGVTMGISKESYGRIVDILDECRKKIIAVAAEDKSIEQVYRLNLQLFPLTKKVKEGNNELA